jgi:hypothetical protein
MKRCDVIPGALACLFGCVACAAGGDIPVYREYSQPILLYDEGGEQVDSSAAAPDQVALRLMRDAQAQEAMMGKETLFDLGFKDRASVLSGQMPPRAMAAPMTGGQENRRRQDESGRNWLAKSLSLPSLGQTTTNAAASAMSAGAQESDWGWLADAVAEGQPGDPATSPEDPQFEDEYNPMGPKNAGRPDGANAYQGDRAAQSEKEKTEKEQATSAAFPERDNQGQKPSDRATERGNASARDLQRGDGVASTTMQSHRTDSPVAEMSQTRQMIADLSAGAQPDFASMRESLLSSPSSLESAPQSGTEQSQIQRPGMEFPSRSVGTTSWGGFGNSQASGPVPAEISSPGSSWKGGWSAQNADGSLLSRFGAYSNPMPVSVAPPATRGDLRPGTPSGGYKPGWY